MPSIRHAAQVAARGLLIVAVLLAAPDASGAQDPAPPRPGMRERDALPAARPTTSGQLPPGRYRVSIASFHVNHATDDDPLEVDGKGDEVYLSVAVLETKATTPVSFTTRSGLVESPVFGDRNGFPQRIKAGSRSAQGGLRTGDDMHLADPFVVWEGPITTPLLIIPTVWEWDSDAGDRRGIVTAWRSRMKWPDARILIHWGPNYRTSANFDYPVVKARGLQELTEYPCGDCFIAENDAAAFGFNNSMSGYNRPIGINMSMGFRPSVVSLSTSNIEAFLGRVNARELSVQYKDNGQGSGNYTVNLRIERVP